MQNVSPSDRRPLYVVALVAAALLGAFGLLVDEVLEGDTLSFDTAVLMAFRTPGDPSNPIGPDWLAEAMRDVTALGSFSVLVILVVLVAAYLALARRGGTSLFLIAAVVSGTIVSTVLKMVFARDRPSLTGVVEVFTKSFPSGHATVSAVVFLTLGTLLAGSTPQWRLKLFYLGAAIVLTLMVGLSRIFLGVHYPTDVLAGWSLGAAWALLCWVAIKALGRRTPGTPPSAQD